MNGGELQEMSFQYCKRDTYLFKMLGIDKLQGDRFDLNCQI